MSIVPNLDAFADAEELWKWGRNSPRWLAKELFPCPEPNPAKRQAANSAARQLLAYAENKSIAMKCRLRGDIQEAQRYEAICERIYAALPEWATW